MGVTYDTGALIAAERNDRDMWALHQGFLDAGIIPLIPAPVLAEAWRGGARQARLVHFLNASELVDFTVNLAKQTGTLAGKARHDDIVDVSVVESALRRRDAIVTSNSGHIRACLDAEGVSRPIHEV